MEQIEFDRVYQFDVGGVHVVFGRTVKDGTSGPVIYGAALSERDLRQEAGGYGATEAEAAADLFRKMAPPPMPGIFG
jgi:hypothetical protein